MATIAKAGPVLLDVSRLISRVGRGPLTGIDRVELAYLRWALDNARPCFALARLAGSFALLDADGARACLDRFEGRVAFGPRDIRARLGWKTAVPRGRAEADTRRLAIARSRNLGSMLAQVPEGTWYLNVGHSNLGEGVLSQLRQAGLRAAVLIHDTIPLDHPSLQRPGTAARFAERFEAVMRHSDLIIANSEVTRSDILRHAQNHPAIVTAHLGVDAVPAGPETATEQPYFIAIGTIEPRKNYAFLLDIWSCLRSEAPPHLHIVGQIGWEDPAILDRLGHAVRDGWLHLHHGADDAAKQALLAGAHGLLFPSLAEGYGLPTLEAARLGVPLICGNLAIHRELHGDGAVYLETDEPYLWAEQIRDLIRIPGSRLIETRNPRSVPSWESHFQAVAAALWPPVAAERAPGS